MGRYIPKGMEALKDIENNEAIKTGNVDEVTKKQFLKGADIAYEQIITSFAEGDKKSLKPLLLMVKDPISSEALVIIEPGRRAALTAIFNVGCIRNLKN